MNLKQLEQLCTASRSKGMPDATPVLFFAGASGVAANASAAIGEASNIIAGSFIVSSTGETVTEATRIALNQAGEE